MIDGDDVFLHRADQRRLHALCLCWSIFPPLCCPAIPSLLCCRALTNTLHPNLALIMPLILFFSVSPSIPSHPPRRAHLLYFLSVAS